MQPHRPGRSATSRVRGFTAIEMLIVISIVTILAAFIIVAALGVHERAQRTGTEGIIASLSAACDRYFKDWDAYPPDNYTDLGGGLGPPARHGLADFTADMNATFTGAECLVLALSSTKLNGPYFKDLKREAVCDLDKDGRADARFTYFEFADAWGGPIRYQNLGKTRGVRLTSAGKDQQFGSPAYPEAGNDDIANRK